ESIKMEEVDEESPSTSFNPTTGYHTRPSEEALEDCDSEMIESMESAEDDSTEEDAAERETLAAGSSAVLQCKTCNGTFLSRRGLKNHEKFHAGQFPIQCPKCPKTFHIEKQLREHNAIEHADDANSSDALDNAPKTPHKCEICNKAFKKKYLL
ncbi:hypothetical protein PFISCL1PPCAC_7223, partial [Pristionchus fissidentatus]